MDTFGEIMARVGPVAAPVHLKFGLRNAPDIYPSGHHLDSVAEAMTRERVRRAQIATEILSREITPPSCSAKDAARLVLVLAADDRWLDGIPETAVR